jgi:hypothetical protein
MLSFFPTDEWMVECNRVYSTPLLPFPPHAAGILSSISVRNSIAADPHDPEYEQKTSGKFNYCNNIRPCPSLLHEAVLSWGRRPIEARHVQVEDDILPHLGTWDS